jgi:hypothetical protein
MNFVVAFWLQPADGVSQIVIPAAVLAAQTPTPIIDLVDDEPVAAAGRQKSLAQQAKELGSQPLVLVDVTGVKPVVAMQRMKAQFLAHPSRRRKFEEMAKANAVMGNCPKSRSSFRSGVNAWCTFADTMYGDENVGWPPSVDGIVQWSHFFGCLGTFCNYEGVHFCCVAHVSSYRCSVAGHVRTACLALGLVAPVASDPALRRARGAIAKRMLRGSKPKRFIQRDCIYNMVDGVRKGIETQKFAMLWLAAYHFMLRVRLSVGEAF